MTPAWFQIDPKVAPDGPRVSSRCAHAASGSGNILNNVGAELVRLGMLAFGCSGGSTQHGFCECSGEGYITDYVVADLVSRATIFKHAALKFKFIHIRAHLAQDGGVS